MISSLDWKWGACAKQMWAFNTKITSKNFGDEASFKIVNLASKKSKCDILNMLISSWKDENIPKNSKNRTGGRQPSQSSIQVSYLRWGWFLVLFLPIIPIGFPLRVPFPKMNAWSHRPCDITFCRRSLTSFWFTLYQFLQILFIHWPILLGGLRMSMSVDVSKLTDI